MVKPKNLWAMGWALQWYRLERQWLPGGVLLGTATTVAVPSIFNGITGCDRLVQISMLFS
jgi:hypothetical protein